MEIKKRNRSELKSFFVKNAIPTEVEFADLIEGMVNQKDDGFAKLPGSPLSIEASGDDASQKKAINFYKNFSDASPNWVFSLNPRSDPAKPATAKPGLSISDSAGNSRFFVDESTGNVGIGTVSPTAKLEVNGNIFAGNSDLYFTKIDHDHSGIGNKAGYAAIENTKNYDALMILGRAGTAKGRTVKLWDYLQVNGALDVTGALGFGSSTRQMLNLYGTDYGVGVQSSTQYFRTGQNFAWYKGGAHNNGALNAGTGGTVQMVIKNGSVGIGTAAPTHLFHVRANNAVGLFESSGSQAYLRLSTNEGLAKRVEIANRPGGRLALWVTSAGDVFNITTAGNVGIGTTAPKAKLDVRGGIFAGNSDLYFTKTNHDHSAIGNKEGYAAIENARNYNALMILGRSNYAGGKLSQRRIRVWDYFQVHGVFVNSSDRRFKRDIEDIPYGLKTLRKLKPVSFNWKNIANPHKSLGFIAQEVQPVIHEAVYADSRDNQPGSPELSVSYTSLIPVLVNAIKELDVKVESFLTAKIRV